MHSEGLSILLFVVFSLLIGSLLKAFMPKSKLPYTIMLLLIGMSISGLNELSLLGESNTITHIINEVSHIDPHLILFLFLPILIFESAYSMEPHLFFRIAPQIVLLAVVGLIISMVLSAFAIHWILSWSMGVAFLFGALISATDPVSVVALLKEKSSRKRLETLIEGESLLNDGTAIVFFSLFYGFALGTTMEVTLLSLVGEFIWVVSLGIGVGVGIGWITLWIIGNLLNQPLIEITLSIVGAYVTFIFCEYIHVSGVVALVSLALMFSTIGRIRISPEIFHFLHQFWEMMAYIANTLIFLIVGMIIITNATFSSLELWITLFILYPLLIVIRTISVLILMPILTRMSVGFTKEKGAVLVWGGLRGAVSLSLALAIAQDSNIPQELREQILFLTAGIVFLTIVINGSTMEWLLKLLHLNKLPPAKELSVQKAQSDINKKMNHFMKKFKKDNFFNKIELDGLAYKIENNNHLAIAKEEITIAFMRRLLEIERSDYWIQFENGHIGRKATFDLSKAVEHALDNNPKIYPRDFLEKSFNIPHPPIWIQKFPIIGKSVEEWLFTRLSLSYDIARGFVSAQEEMRKHVHALQPTKESGKYMKEMIDKNISRAFEFSTYINEKYPKLIQNLQSKSVRRLLLNHERTLIWEMEEEGVLEHAEAQSLIDNIEIKMSDMRKEIK